MPTPGLAVAVALPPVNVQGDESVYTHTAAHTKRARLSVCRAECARRPIEQELSAGALGAAGARPTL